MTSATTATTTRAASTMGGLSKAADLICNLSKLDPYMKLNELQLLLHVAQNQNREGGYTTSDLKSALRLNGPTTTRLTYYWANGVYGSPGTGLGMIDVTIDDTDRRRRILRLTPKGEDFVRQLDTLLT